MAPTRKYSQKHQKQVRHNSCRSCRRKDSIEIALYKRAFKRRSVLFQTITEECNAPETISKLDQNDTVRNETTLDVKGLDTTSKELPISTDLPEGGDEWVSITIADCKRKQPNFLARFRKTSDSDNIDQQSDGDSSDFSNRYDTIERESCKIESLEIGNETNGVCKKKFPNCVLYAMKETYEKVEKVEFLDFVFLLLSFGIIIIGLLHLDDCKASPKLATTIIIYGGLDFIANMSGFWINKQYCSKIKGICKLYIRYLRAAMFFSHVYGMVLTYKIFTPETQDVSHSNFCDSNVFWPSFVYFNLYVVYSVGVLLAMIIASLPHCLHTCD